VVGANGFNPIIVHANICFEDKPCFCHFLSRLLFLKGCRQYALITFSDVFLAVSFPLPPVGSVSPGASRLVTFTRSSQ
jgi:hypothetical protein